jgi:hypothetical protein
VKRISILAVALSLSACASFNSLPLLGTGQDHSEAAIVKLTTVAISDLQNAAADAVAHNDPVAAQCWTGLIPVAQQIQALLAPPAAAPAPTPVTSCGTRCFFSNIQAARDVKTEVNSLAQLRSSGKLAQIRQAVNLACGALYADIKLGVVDPLGLASGVATPAP